MKNLDEILTKNVKNQNIYSPRLTSGCFPPDKKFLNVFFMGNKA